MGHGGTSLKIRELHRALPRLGFHVVRRTGGHVTYEHESGRRVTITGPHGKADVSKPVLRSIGGVLGIRGRQVEELVRRKK